MRFFVCLCSIAAADELINWFTTNGGELHDVDVRYTVTAGRGLFATKNLTQGTSVVALPTALTLGASACLDKKDSYLHQLPSKVRANLNQGHLLVVLCVLELQRNNDPFWMPYISALPDATNLPLVQAVREDLNHTFQGSQLLREVQKVLKDATKVYGDGEVVFNPPLSSWCSLEEFISAYAMVESRAHAKVVQGVAMSALLPVIDLVNHKSGTANAELRPGPSGTVNVVLLRDLEQGEEVYINYMGRQPERRTSFYRQFAVDDDMLHNDIKLGFSLRPSDPMYDEKKMRFPPHMIEAKKLYAELAYLLPREKQAELPQALSFPHFLELSCDRDLQPQEHPVLQFLRFAVSSRVPSKDECPGVPPMCPYLDAATELKAERRFQADLLKYRAEYKDFASPRAGAASQILDDERRCLDNFLSEAGAPPPPMVGLYSGCALLAVLSAMALFRAQKALWSPQSKRDVSALENDGTQELVM